MKMPEQASVEKVLPPLFEARDVYGKSFSMSDYLETRHRNRD